MSDDKTPGTALSDEELQELVAATDTGGRSPAGPVAKLLAGVALIWSLFQLWIASPIPFIVGIGVFNDTEARSIHLAIAVFLAFLAYPALKSSPRDRIPIQDWAMAVVAAFCAAYIFLFYVQLSDRPNNPNGWDIGVAVVGMLLLLEATRRALGPPLMIVAIVFLIYTFGGPHMPGILAWKGASFGAVAYHQWISTEGVFGIALATVTAIAGVWLVSVGFIGYFTRPLNVAFRGFFVIAGLALLLPASAASWAVWTDPLGFVLAVILVAYEWVGRRRTREIAAAVSRDRRRPTHS
jgi:TRAP-type uncharacterized transport system fused permease subunit